MKKHTDPPSQWSREQGARLRSPARRVSQRQHTLWNEATRKGPLQGLCLVQQIRLEVAWGRCRQGGQRESKQRQSHVRGSWEATNANRRGGGAWLTATNHCTSALWPGQVSWAGTATLDICRPGSKATGKVWPSPGKDASRTPCLGGK